MSKYANAIQMTTPSQVLLPTFVLGFVAHLVRKYKFLENIAFIVSPGVPHAAKATEREHQNCFKSENFNFLKELLCSICRPALVICFHKGRLFFTVNDSRKSHRNIGRWKSNTLKFLNVLRDQPTKQLIQSHSKPSKQTRQPTEQVTNIRS